MSAPPEGPTARSSPSSAAGTCIVDANQAGNANWNAAPQVQQSFTVKNNQTITFTSTAPGNASVGGATYTPTAIATSGLAVTITLDGIEHRLRVDTAGVVSFRPPAPVSWTPTRPATAPTTRHPRSSRASPSPG